MAQLSSKQKILFITGKGGVGKSTVAAAMAQEAALRGDKTLLVELGDQSFFSYIYKKSVTYEPVSVAKNLDVALWDGEGCLREYVLYLLRVKKLVDLFFDNKVMRTFVRAAPALRELAILGKITSGARKWGPPLPYDRLIVDGYSSGHFLALLKAPQGMGELISTGSMGEQSRNMIAVLKNAQICEYKIVSVPEEMATSETLELRRDLESFLNVPTEVWCNRMIPFRNKVSDWDFFKDNLTPGHPDLDVAINMIRMMERQGEEWQRLAVCQPRVRQLPFVFRSEAEEVISAVQENLHDIM